ncbi:MobA/MobL family protein [Ruegeria sp. HKCCD6604]|uniref:MobA/MobL family protein n=1 Tax=Ruegeria sp. HKCCD6604 TaxID=2683000 RepID=UPI0014926296|nr:MobA/MobL family protein [Ruegeria sp. HKCCD6604]NOC91506.1 MobA/MobL family protein [Ruegeria sp. HKCCD6604]
MALFSFRHSTKTFSLKVERHNRKAQLGQTAAHLRYITRTEAARVVMQERLSSPSLNAAAKDAEEAAMKRKGRVAERFIIALPIEATSEQREALVRAFCEEMTKQKAGFVAAIHDVNGNDQSNPHAHIVLFDTYERSGGRGRPRSVIGMARKHAVENAARDWSKLHNQMMTDWGFDQNSQIDHRSFEARGIERIPTIHEGSASRAVRAKGGSLESKNDWEHVDAGKTRVEANALIREINQTNEQLETINGLAKCYGKHRDGSKSSVTQSRPDSWSGSAAATDTAPAFFQHKGAEAGDRKPKRAFGGPEGRNGEFLGATQEHPGFLPLGLPGRLPRRRRVRRLFVELMMLRDTLRARLSLRRKQGMDETRRRDDEAKRFHQFPVKKQRVRRSTSGIER